MQTYNLCKRDVKFVHGRCIDHRTNSGIEQLTDLIAGANDHVANDMRVDTSMKPIQ